MPVELTFKDGKIIDQDGSAPEALKAALREGRLAAAALDVLEAARRSAREGVTVTLPGHLPHEEQPAP